jgi:hypothetical protein
MVLSQVHYQVTLSKSKILDNMLGLDDVNGDGMVQKVISYHIDAHN